MVNEKTQKEFDLLCDIMYPAQRIPNRPITLPFVKLMREWIESTMRNYGWSTTSHSKELERLFNLSVAELRDEMLEVNRTRQAEEVES